MALAETDKPMKIAIIGGGFCGILTAINLLRDREQRLHIHIVNKEYDVAAPSLKSRPAKGGGLP